MNARTALAHSLPAPMRTALRPAVRYGDMLLLDHLFVRVLFPNRHKISSRAWRAAQPLPHQFATLKSLGIKTVVNLRGNAPKSTYTLEREACEKHGLQLVDYRLRSRDAPSREELRGLRDLFQTVEHPILLHCKSGADRAGLASVIYRHVVDGVPIADARRELSLRYGHIRQADTGVLDYFFDRYLEDAAREPLGFFDWVETRYDPGELKQAFRAKGWANRLVNGLLRRE